MNFHSSIYSSLMYMCVGGVSACVGIHSCACVFAQVCAHATGDPRSELFFQSLSILLIKARSLSPARLVQLASLLLGFPPYGCLLGPSPDILNACPQDCAKSTLTTVPSPQPVSSSSFLF